MANTQNDEQEWDIDALFANQWILDSACSQHMTGDKDMLVNPVKYDGGEFVLTGDNSIHSIAHVGDVHLSVTNTNKNVVFNDVFHVPCAKKNLLSVSQITSNGCYVLFGPNDVKIFDEFETSSQPVLLGYRTNNMYVLSAESTAGVMKDDDSVTLKVGEEKEIGGKGLTKKLVKEGEGWDTPDNDDDVEVNYEVRLEDGTLVAKSDGVEFIVKDGHFCPALSKAVKTMKKGEKVILTVKPQCGFGEKGKQASGNEGGVPPNATLQITLELVSWNPVLYVTKDRKVTKKILKGGAGYERPNEAAVVLVKFIGKLQDGTVFTKRGYDETDEGKIIEGIDKAISTMKLGEVAVVTIAPEYAFGSTETKQELAVVPPNSTVIYEIELESFFNDNESWVKCTQEKIKAVGEVKEEGNILYKAGKYLEASEQYEMAVNNLECDAFFW